MDQILYRLVSNVVVTLSPQEVVDNPLTQGALGSVHGLDVKRLEQGDQYGQAGCKDIGAFCRQARDRPSSLLLKNRVLNVAQSIGGDLGAKSDGGLY